LPNDTKELIEMSDDSDQELVCTVCGKVISDDDDLPASKSSEHCNSCYLAWADEFGVYGRTERIPDGEDGELVYRGFFNSVNERPAGEYVQLFVSDWNKEHWAFYAYVDPDSYEDDLDAIGELRAALNWRDGDIYVELIDRSEGLKGFYEYLYSQGYMTHSDVMDRELWEILEEKGDDHFRYFQKYIGSSYREDLLNFEYSVFEDWYDALETYNPDLYKTLDEANGLSCFDISQFYNCQGFHEEGDQVVLVYN